MTNKEARNILLTSIHPQTSEEAEAIGIAVKAVERMIPKELIKDKKELMEGGGFVTFLRCPKCNEIIGFCGRNNKIDWNRTLYSDYCCYCSQKLDWSEEQE